MTSPTPTDVNTLIERCENHDIFGDGTAFYAVDVPKAEQLLDEAAQALRAMQARVGELSEYLEKSVPSCWPLGEGAVLTAGALAEGQSLFLLRAVSDDLIGIPGENASMDTWDKLEHAPTLTLSFKNEAAIKQHIAELESLLASTQQEAQRHGE